MKLFCKWFGHKWKLKERCGNKRHSMKCVRCGKILLVKGKIDVN